jgi:hypothetical protein
LRNLRLPVPYTEDIKIGEDSSTRQEAYLDQALLAHLS